MVADWLVVLQPSSLSDERALAHHSFSTVCTMVPLAISQKFCGAYELDGSFDFYGTSLIVIKSSSNRNSLSPTAVSIFIPSLRIGFQGYPREMGRETHLCAGPAHFFMLGHNRTG